MDGYRFAIIVSRFNGAITEGLLKGARACLEEADVRHSASVLRECGNISSPAVLFSLQAACAENNRGGWWWLSSFGAGFSCHGALLRVE